MDNSDYSERYILYRSKHIYTRNPNRPKSMVRGDTMLKSEHVFSESESTRKFSYPVGLTLKKI